MPIESTWIVSYLFIWIRGFAVAVFSTYRMLFFLFHLNDRSKSTTVKDDLVLLDEMATMFLLICPKIMNLEMKCTDCLGTLNEKHLQMKTLYGSD
jgi:hypothetical protein